MFLKILVLTSNGGGFMAKILISDLIGTLIPDCLQQLDYFYCVGNYNYRSDSEIFADKVYYKSLFDKAFEQTSKQLAEFLRDGNYLKLVTAVDSHDTADFVYNELIVRFAETLKEYEDRISIFLAGRPRDLDWLSKAVNLIQKEDSIIATNSNGISAVFIDGKVKVFDSILKEHNLITDRMFVIGDSEGDIPMFVKGIELGARCSIINNYLYSSVGYSEMNTDKVIYNKAVRNIAKMVDDLVRFSYTNFDNMSYDEKCLVREKLLDEHWSEWIYKELEMLYTSLNVGEIDVNELLKEQEIYDFLERYNNKLIRHFNNNEQNIESVDITLNSKLTMFPTFNDYCDKVLIYKRDFER